MTYRSWAGSSETEQVMCGLLITKWGKACWRHFCAHYRNKCGGRSNASTTDTSARAHLQTL